MLVAAIPTWPYNKSWGYYPSGGIGILLVAAVALLFAGKI
ncbi:MAG: DUF3309 domain-containing protein [Terracidiphilus sp.]